MKTPLRAMLLIVALNTALIASAQTTNLSGYWKNESGKGANWVQLRDEVWFVSIAKDWKEYFEGKVLNSLQIEGRLIKINLKSGQRYEGRLKMELAGYGKIAVLNSPVNDGSYTSNGILSYAGYYSKYEDIPEPVFDEKHHLWEVKTWFQDGDSIAAVAIIDGEPVYDRGVFVTEDSLQVIRQLKWSAHPCHYREVLHYKLEKDGSIRFHARNIGGTCSTSLNQAWGGTTRLRYIASGQYPPGNGPIDARDVAIPANILLLRIDAIAINGQGVPFVEKKPLKIDERQEIAFQFSSAVPRLELYYQLSPYDPDWQLGFPEQKASYAHLPEGNYTFKVTTDPDRQNPDINTLTFPFRVFRPFYRQGWFFIAIFLALALLTVWIFKWREQQRRKLEKLRQDIARELHDDIGSTLSSINMLTTAAKRRTIEPTTTGSLDRIGLKAQEALDNIGDILWTMHSRESSSEDLLLRMKAFAVEILEARGANVHFDTSGDSAGLNLQGMQSKDLYLLFKEAINNAAKYSHASEVHISIHTQKGKIRLIIQDNGCGFEPITAPRGNGLSSMQQRAKRLGGQLQIESALGAGTRIVLEV